MGDPVAFIEVAWRRYTKHSRNRAQEIQGAILPLAEKYKATTPFLGAVLSGEFTGGSIQQLNSHHFHVLYFPYETLINAFSAMGINIAFDESTPDKAFQECIKKINSISCEETEKIKEYIVISNKNQLVKFVNSLGIRFSRVVEKVVVMPLYGTSNEFTSILDAINFLKKFSNIKNNNEFQKYEIVVSFSNGDRVEGSYKDRTQAWEFLNFVARQ